MPGLDMQIWLGSSQTQQEAAGQALCSSFLLKALIFFSRTLCNGPCCCSLGIIQAGVDVASPRDILSSGKGTVWTLRRTGKGEGEQSQGLQSLWPRDIFGRNLWMKCGFWHFLQGC